MKLAEFLKPTFEAFRMKNFVCLQIEFGGKLRLRTHHALRNSAIQNKEWLNLALLHKPWRYFKD